MTKTFSVFPVWSSVASAGASASNRFIWNIFLKQCGLFVVLHCRVFWKYGYLILERNQFLFKYFIEH